MGKEEIKQQEETTVEPKAPETDVFGVPRETQDALKPAAKENGDDETEDGSKKEPAKDVDIENYPVVQELRKQVETIKNEYGTNLSGRRKVIDNLQKQLKELQAGKAPDNTQATTPFKEIKRSKDLSMCRKRPSPLASGQPRTWACAILYELGRVNFLSDPSTQPHMTLAELCTAFGVGQSTASAKARVIANTLGVNRLNPSWMLPSLVETHPLVWMADVNGVPVDLRTMPREVQEIAFEKGMIPYIPADRE